jgi:hypothetical protein
VQPFAFFAFLRAARRSSFVELESVPPTNGIPDFTPIFGNAFSREQSSAIPLSVETIRNLIDKSNITAQF